MKKLILISVCLSFLFAFPSCEKDCGADAISACSDTVPIDESCRAVHDRWFYSSETDACLLVKYQGCTVNGFQTKEECKSCRCN